jgi:hypothetical protein
MEARNKLKKQADLNEEDVSRPEFFDIKLNQFASFVWLIFQNSSSKSRRWLIQTY